MQNPSNSAKPLARDAPRQRRAKSRDSRGGCGGKGVETRRGAPKVHAVEPRTDDGEGIVQRTNGAARRRLRKKQCDENPPP
ncbi:hypothetical protein DO71_5690 [Burkholderia pseudomallei]|nr:hypothetical protein DO71_5690 [Burkholderia pseudomallei]